MTDIYRYDLYDILDSSLNHAMLRKSTGAACARELRPGARPKAVPLVGLQRSLPGRRDHSMHPHHQRLWGGLLDCRDATNHLIIWLVVWTIFFSNILGVIIPSHEFFSQMGWPPTRSLDSWIQPPRNWWVLVGFNPKGPTPPEHQGWLRAYLALVFTNQGLLIICCCFLFFFFLGGWVESPWIHSPL